jgi:hypothetical protein
MDFQKFAQSIIDTLLSEKGKAAQYAEGGWRGDAPALAQRFIEEQRLAEGEGEREKDIQQQKLASEMARTQATESGALERAKLAEEGATGRARIGVQGALDKTRLTEEGATGRARMTEAGALDRAKLTDTGATTRTILQEGGLDRRAKAQEKSPGSIWVENAPKVYEALVNNPAMTPELLEQGMQMYWTQAAALGGGGDMDFTPVDQASAPPVATSQAGLQAAKPPARSPIATASTPKAEASTGTEPALRKPVSTRTPVPEGAPTPFSPRSDQTPATPWGRKLTETFPQSSGLHALGSAARRLGGTGALKRFPSDSILGRLHERYYNR